MIRNEWGIANSPQLTHWKDIIPHFLRVRAQSKGGVGVEVGGGYPVGKWGNGELLYIKELDTLSPHKPPISPQVSRRETNQQRGAGMVIVHRGMPA